MASFEIPDPVPMIMDLRLKALSLAPEDVGVSEYAGRHAFWGLLMETGYPDGLATLLVLADGTVSLYLGHGGGIIGGGQHDSVWQTALDMLACAERHQDDLDDTQDFPLPMVGQVTFYALGPSQVLMATADEDDLGMHRHALSDLFHVGHAVITQLRLSSENADNS